VDPEGAIQETEDSMKMLANNLHCSSQRFIDSFSGEGDNHVRSICHSYPNSSERASTFFKNENLIPKSRDAWPLELFGPVVLIQGNPLSHW
jgi:hypothetical protein